MDRQRSKAIYGGLVKFLLKFGFQLFDKSPVGSLRQEDHFFQRKVLGEYHGKERVLYFVDAYYYSDREKKTDVGTIHRQIEGILFDAVLFNAWTSDVGATITVDMRDFKSIQDVLEFYEKLFNSLACRPCGLE